MAVKVWRGAVDGKFLTQDGNWEGGAPTTGDSVVVPSDATVDIDQNLNAIAVDLAGFLVEEGCAIDIGLSDDPLQLSMNSTSVALAGVGESYFDIDDASEITITKSGPAPATGRYSTNLLGESGSADRNEIIIRCATGESIGIGTNNKVSTVMETNSIQVAGGEVTIGGKTVDHDGAGAPELDMSGGSVTNNTALGTVQVFGATLTHDAGAINVLQIHGGGTVFYNSTGTVSTMTLLAGGSVSFANDHQAKTVTSFGMNAGSVMLDPYAVVTWSNDINIAGAGILDVTIDVGPGVQLNRTAI